MKLKYFFQLALCAALAFAAVSPAFGQLNYGFRAGLNFASFRGDSEVNDSGMELESWENYTGFHLGITLGYSITDHFSIRSGFEYSKRGSKYTYDGQMYRIFSANNNSINTFGTGLIQLVVNNTYLDLPVLAVGRFGDFEVFGGGYLGLLVQSVGEGSLRYEGNAVPLNQSTGEVRFNLQHNYRRDDLGEAANAAVTENVRLNGVTIPFPKTLGAYYDYPAGSDPAPLYNGLDYGLIGGVSYFVSSALYVSARLQYGLSDVTRTEGDLARARLTDGAQTFRDDKDRNFVIQLSVGFTL